jgi:regulator of cell morphogenesis and NO signaling
MEVSKDSIIGQLVAEDYRFAAVFKKYGIDFCCNGNRTIDQACTQKKIESINVVSALTNVKSISVDSNTNFKDWPADLLVDYIEKKHHRYVKEKLPLIDQFLHKVKSVHGERHPELIEIYDLFNESNKDLSAHMNKEEIILFPYIRQLSMNENQNQLMGNIISPIKMMMKEHDVEGGRFRKISELTDNYTPPLDACTTYKVAFSMLEEFENDLHQHIHLENNILFPKAIELEENLLALAN